MWDTVIIMLLKVPFITNDTSVIIKAQFTPPTSTPLNCRVASAVWTHPSAVVTQFTIMSCIVEPIAVRLLRLVTSDDIMMSLLKKFINIDQNLRSQTAMFSFQTVCRICRQSSWASYEFSKHRRRRRDATRQLSLVGVDGVYWSQTCSQQTCCTVVWCCFWRTTTDVFLAPTPRPLAITAEWR